VGAVELVGVGVGSGPSCFWSPKFSLEYDCGTFTVCALVG
jgi:hypothetical protein